MQHHRHLLCTERSNQRKKSVQEKTYILRNLQNININKKNPPFPWVLFFGGEEILFFNYASSIFANGKLCQWDKWDH